MSDPVVLIQRAVHFGIPAERSLLGVSGGVDSMVLLHAALAVRKPEDLVVASFDHATGEHATRAVELVERAAMSAGVALVVGRAEPTERPSEAGWRAQRLGFLRAAAAEHQATICTAHTADDQVETILFRELRDAGPRGLAGLAAAGVIRRPLLAFSRAEISEYATRAGVEWEDDPTNLDTHFARNRLRHEILPALRRIAPTIDAELVALGERAAGWRAEVESFVDARVRFAADSDAGTLTVESGSLSGFPEGALGIIWPALLARIGVVADRRGTRRLAAFTIEGSTGQRIQLSGGWTVYRRRGVFEVCREAGPAEGPAPGEW